MAFRAALRSHLPPVAFDGLVRLYTRANAVRLGARVRRIGDIIEIAHGNRVVRISASHLIYAIDVVKDFNFYFSAVEPYLYRGKSLVDYSFPRFHKVVGFDAHPVMFASFAEPLATVDEYLRLAGLAPGMSVIDLGAYSGLSAILFKQVVGSSGRVVAVEADEQNAICVKENLSLFKKVTGLDIDLSVGAVWEHDDGLEFSAEGNMGASAISLVGSGRGLRRQVPSFTLSSIVARHGLKAVDFVKCDIEGAESVIFSDAAFFARFKPHIVIEAHRVNGVMTTTSCVSALQAHGYVCTEVAQPGVDLPLIDCRPKR